jgi:alpha-1,3-rhamnosyltransferase
MQLTPLVSVIIPAYNHEQYVTETLESIRNQSYENIEVIILNDGSKDGTKIAIQAFAAGYAKSFKHFLFIDKANEGVTKTLNRGINVATGEYVFLIASDDLLIDHRAIEKLVKKITSSPAIGMVCGDAHFINHAGVRTQKIRGAQGFGSFVQFNFPSILGLDIENDFGSYKSLLIGNYIPAGALIRKSAYATIGTYHEDKILEDYGFWLRMSKEYKIILHPEILLHYRIHEKNTVSVQLKKIQLEVADLLLNEHEYAKKNGLSKYWRLGALSAGLQLLKSVNPEGSSRMLKLLALSAAAWPNEFCLSIRRRYDSMWSRK